MKAQANLIVRARLIAGLLGFSISLAAQAADYLTPSDIVLPTETASQESVAQSAARSTLRWGGLDFYPHAAVTSLFDDNIFISHDHPLSDVEWTLSPGVTIAAGDIAAALPGAVTMDQIRGLLNYSLGDDNSKPQRYLALDYTPGVNLFTEHNELNNVDHLARLSGGYSFGHLAVALDQDFTRAAVKENTVGTRVTTAIYNTEIRSRYDVNDRSSFNVDGRYYRLAYADSRYQGYQEFRNEDWYNRFVGTKLSLGVGAAFGLVDPAAGAHQTYQQALLRATYQVTGKLDLRPSVGIEWREFSHGGKTSVYPIFGLMAVYRARETTLITLEAHRRDEPSHLADANYTTLGFSGGVRQLIGGRLAATLTAGYEHIDFTGITNTNLKRSDDYFTFRTSLDYELNRHWAASLYYIRLQAESSETQLSFGNNMVGARITWRF